MRGFDYERNLFEYDASISISEIKKDYYSGKGKRHFPVFNSQKYFKTFLEGGANFTEMKVGIKDLQEKETIFERKPIRIEVISKMQKALGIRARNGIIFQESLVELQKFVQGEFSENDFEDLVDLLETEHSEFVQLCRDPNYFLKKKALQDKIGTDGHRRIQKYQQYYQKCEGYTNH